MARPLLFPLEMTAARSARRLAALPSVAAGITLLLSFAGAERVARAGGGTPTSSTYDIVERDVAARVGLAARGSGVAVADGLQALGAGGELLYRATGHLTVELGVDYQRSAGSGLVSRRDLPVDVGLRLHLAGPDALLSPYLVLAGGVDSATQQVAASRDEALFVEAQLGVGLELRLGAHLAIGADARADGRKRVNDPTAATLAARLVDGQRVPPLGDQLGVVVRVSAAVYF